MEKPPNLEGAGTGVGKNKGVGRIRASERLDQNFDLKPRSVPKTLAALALVNIERGTRQCPPVKGSELSFITGLWIFRTCPASPQGFPQFPYTHHQKGTLRDTPVHCQRKASRTPSICGGLKNLRCPVVMGIKGHPFLLVECKGIGTLTQKKEKKRKQPTGQRNCKQPTGCSHCVLAYCEGPSAFKTFPNLPTRFNYALTSSHD